MVSLQLNTTKISLKDYLHYESTNVSCDDLWSKMLKADPLSRNTVYLTEVVLKHKKEQLMQLISKDKRPLKALKETFAKILETRERNQQSVKEGDILYPGLDMKKEKVNSKDQVQETGSESEQESTSTQPRGRMRHHFCGRKRQPSPITSSQQGNGSLSDLHENKRQISTTKAKNAQKAKRKTKRHLEKSTQAKKAKASKDKTKHKTILADDRIREENRMSIEIENIIANVMTSAIADQPVSWKIWMEELGKTTIYEVTCTDLSSLGHLSNLFYGIRCLFAHGTAEYTTETGILSDKRAPKQSSDLGIQMVGNPSDKRCEEHVFRLWGEAKENGNQMSVDYNLFCTMHSFYTNFAATLSMMCTHLACDLFDEDREDVKNMKKIIEELDTTRVHAKVNSNKT